MPPVVNTYGVGKKKRRGIPKFILKEAPSTDLFEALRIENIKEPKAIADAKKKEKRRLKTVQKPAVLKPSQPVCRSFNGDNTFDKLLNDSCDWLPSSKVSNSRPLNDSSSSDEFFKERAARETVQAQERPLKFSYKIGGNGLKGVTKKRTVRTRTIKEDSIFALSFCHETSLDALPLAKRLKENKKTVLANKENLDLNDGSLSDEAKYSTSVRSLSFATPKISVTKDVQTCEEKPLSPISPILPPHGSTSTPCDKQRVNFWPSPISSNQSPFHLGQDADVFSPAQNQEESVDLFSSYEQHNEDTNRPLNDCAASGILMSFNLECQRNLHNAERRPCEETREVPCGSVSLDLFQSDTTIPLPDHTEESCMILESSNPSINVEPLKDCYVVVDKCDRNMLTSANSQGSEDNSIILEESSVNSEGSSSKWSSGSVNQLQCPENLTLEAKSLKDCYVVVTKCDRSMVTATSSKESEENCRILEESSVTSDESTSKQIFADFCTSPVTSIGSVSQLQCLENLTLEAKSEKQCYVVIDRCDGKNFSSSIRKTEENSVNPDESSISSEGANSAIKSPTVSVGNESQLQGVGNITAHLDELKLSPTISLDHNFSDHMQEEKTSDKIGTISPESAKGDADGIKLSSNRSLGLDDEIEIILDGYDFPVNAERANTVKVMVGTSENMDCDVLLESCDASKQQLRNSFSKLKMSRLSQNYRLSIKPETVVLKPGKQWRRSLSILSKIRTSAGDSSGCSSASASLSTEDTKLKGKLWESAVNSVVELQPDIIFEDSENETSIISLRSSLGRFSTSYRVCENISNSVSDMRESSESGAAQIFKRCGQDGPVSFHDHYPPNMKKNTKKIGEGVYGEVFFYSGCADHPPSVIKIIPIEGSIDVNGEPQKKFGEIISEVCVAQELSKLRLGSENVTSSFNEVQAIHCVQGSYPTWLQDLWHEYDESKGSENDSPEMFQEDQLYVVLELQNGGKDLESFIFSSAHQGLAAFKQIALTLAVGEKALNFEHRDLHWGNVLISSTKVKDIHFILDGKSMSTPSGGIEVSIIDFTLSRITDPCSGRPIYFDLAHDDTLFTAQGDYQFEIYRLMKEYCGNKWESFTPKSNIAWLHYLLDKFCTMARYKNRTSKLHNKALNVLLEMKDTVLMFENVSQFVKCSLFSN